MQKKLTKSQVVQLEREEVKLPQNSWTAKEVALLLEASKRFHPVAIARSGILKGKTYDAVLNKLKRLGVRSRDAHT